MTPGGVEKANNETEADNYIWCWYHILCGNKDKKIIKKKKTKIFTICRNVGFDKVHLRKFSSVDSVHRNNKQKQQIEEYSDIRTVTTHCRTFSFVHER